MAQVPDPASQRTSAGALIIVVQLRRCQRLEESTWKQKLQFPPAQEVAISLMLRLTIQTDRTDTQRTSADLEKMKPTVSTILAVGCSSGGRDLLRLGGKNTSPVGFREGQQATHNLRQEQQT